MHQCDFIFSDSFFTETSRWPYINTRQSPPEIKAGRLRRRAFKRDQKLLVQRIFTGLQSPYFFSTQTGIKLGGQLQRHGDSIFYHNFNRLCESAQTKRKKSRFDFTQRKKTKIFKNISEAINQCPILKLPQEILVSIFSICPLEDFQSIPRVCKLWNDLSHDNSLTACKCQELMATFPIQPDQLKPEKLKLLKLCQPYVHKLDLSSLSFMSCAYRVIDTVIPIFRKLEELSLPSFDFHQFEKDTFYLKESSSPNLEHIPKIQKLDWLSLEFFSMNEAMIRYISQCQNLKTLSLYGSGVLTRKMFQILSQSQTIEFLIFGYQQFDAGHIKHLKTMNNLKKLAFYNCDISQKGMRIFHLMTHLTFLSFHKPTRRFKMFKCNKILTKFVNLEYLAITGCTLKDPALRAITELPHLTTLQLSGNGYHEETLQNIKKTILKNRKEN